MAATAVLGQIDSNRPVSAEPTVVGRISSVMEKEKTEIDDGPERLTLDDLNIRLEPSERPGSLGRLHKYEVLEIIGKGGCGVVLKAFEESLERMVAIKVMLAEMSVTSPARKRFLREGRSSAAIRNEHVVQIYAVEEKPIPYLVMEFIPGESLQQRIERTGPLEVLATLKIGHQVAQGLAAAHAMGIIHRDIKPANVLVEDQVDLRVKITDFGMARTADDASLTQTGMVAGTPMYMAPEQARGEKVDHRSDLFSLGSVLYVMITGRAPFRASNLLAVIQRVAQDEPRDIREIIPETPDWLCDIIGRLQTKDPNERIQTASEVAELLGKCIKALEAKQNPEKLLPFRIKSRPSKIGRPALWGGMALAVFAAVTFGSANSQNTFSTNAQALASASTPKIEITENSASAKAKPDVAFDPESHKPFTNRLGMKFVHVPKGTYWWAGEQKHSTERDFYISAYEVTQKQWETIMGRELLTSNYTREGQFAEQIKDLSDEQVSRIPVNIVTWENSQSYLNRLNDLYGEKGWRYRLPTVYEWRVALSGGLKDPEQAGRFDYYGAEPSNTLTPAMANFVQTGLNRPAPVGSFQPNALGIYDMHGNVFEWLQDGTNETQACLVGGCWFDIPETCALKRVAIGSRSMIHVGGGLRVVLADY